MIEQNTSPSRSMQQRKDAPRLLFRETAICSFPERLVYSNSINKQYRSYFTK